MTETVDQLYGMRPSERENQITPLLPSTTVLLFS